MRLCLAALTVVLISGCGESTEEIYERGYEDGYNQGQYDVCEEAAGISAGVKDRLSNCRGF